MTSTDILFYCLYLHLIRVCVIFFKSLEEKVLENACLLVKNTRQGIQGADAGVQVSDNFPPQHQAQLAFP